MNKNYLIFTILMISLMLSQPSFAMYGAIFKAARTVGMTILPACGLYLCNEESKQKKESNEFFKRSPLISETALTTWGKEKMEQLNVPHSESISFMYGLDWATSAEQFVLVPRWKGYQLNYALQSKNSSCMDLFYKIRYLGDDPDKTIARHSMALKHEIGHIINKDMLKRTYYLAAIPVAVEAMSFGMTKILRNLCNIQQQPKTFLTTMLRSCSAVGAIIPKALIGSAAYIFSKKYQEARADRFACKNAESRLELEEMEKLFQDIKENNDLKENQVKDLMDFCLWTGKFKSIPREIRKECIEYFEKGLQEIAQQLNDSNVSEQKKRILNHIVQVVRSPDHPSSEKRAKNVRKYIDKWDRDHIQAAEEKKA
jgi:Peptidase family M48